MHIAAWACLLHSSSIWVQQLECTCLLGVASSTPWRWRQGSSSCKHSTCTAFCLPGPRECVRHAKPSPTSCLSLIHVQRMLRPHLHDLLLARAPQPRRRRPVPQALLLLKPRANSGLACRGLSNPGRWR